MLKRTITKLEDVSEELRQFYAPAGEGGTGFVLQVEGKPAEDVTALKNAKDHEKNLRVAAERERDAAKAAQAEAETERAAAEQAAQAAVANKGQDVQALEASWQQKLNDAEKKRADEVAERDGEIERLLVTNTATSLAAEISTIPELFADSVIAKRLKVEVGADKKRFLRVLDDAGQPTAKTLDELKQELLANEKYAAIVIAGKGSGGGAGKVPSGGGAAEKKYLDYSDTELSELRRTDKPKYDRLLAAHRAGEDKEKT